MTGVNGQIITSETNKTKNEISETKGPRNCIIVSKDFLKITIDFNWSV